MKIVVISAFEASSLFAHAINTVKMAQGFTRLGHEVTIICRSSTKGKISTEALSNIYGLTEAINWIQLPNKILNSSLGKHWQFSLLTIPIILKIKPDLVFTRSYIAPWISSKSGIATVAESHAPPDTKSFPFFCLVEATHHNKFKKWVTISRNLASYYQSLGVAEEKLLVLPDAVDLPLFKPPETLPTNPYSSKKVNIAYVGHLYDYKGIPTVLETAALLPEINFHFVGGWQEDIDKQKEKAEELNLHNVTFYGLKTQTEVPPFLWHADILLLPPSQRHPSAAWTSPVKLGEYLASGTPVIATDIPALRDWLTDEEVKFVEPDNPQSFAEGIKYLLDNPQQVKQMQQSGWLKAQELSYKQRALNIINACK